MLRTLLDHNVLTALIGAVVVVAVGAAAYSLNAPRGFILVAGLAAGAPLLNLGGFAANVDTEAYLDEKGREGALVDAAVTVVGALAVGAVTAVVVSSARITGALFPALIAAATFLGGNAPFAARNRKFAER